MLSLNYIFIFKSVNMKCHSDKINNFLNSDNVDLITKEFVINLFTKFIKNVNEDIISSKILFIDLGFYEVEKSDLENEDEDELEVIDFYKISNCHIELKKMMFDYFLKTIAEDDDTTDFGESFFVKDLKMIVPYSDWERVNRKNKLDNINKLNEN